MPRKLRIPIQISTTTEVHIDERVDVDIDETVYIDSEDVLKAIEEDPSILDKLGFVSLNQFKNLTLLDSIKLLTFSEILEKCTLDDLEKFKQTL